MSESSEKTYLNRRETVVGLTSLALGSTALAPEAIAQSPAPNFHITGYTDKESYTPGEKVTLYLSAFDNKKDGKLVGTPVTMPLVNVTWNLYDSLDDTIKASGQITINKKYEPKDSVDQGWATDGFITLPVNLVAGCYYIRFNIGTWKYIYFVVREPSRVNLATKNIKPADILVVISTWTMQAYNAFGGRSAYIGSPISTKLSLARPYGDTFRDRWVQDPNKTQVYKFGMGHVANWLRKEYSCNFATDADLHFNTDELLKGRKCVVFIGQNEYWTREMRDNLQNYLNAGGNMANLAGCTQWWRTIYSAEGKTLDFSDKLANPKVRWHTLSGGGSAKIMFGTGFEHGAFNKNRRDSLDATIYNSQHWLYDGSGVQNYETFGKALALAPYEVDGVNLQWLGLEPRVAPNSSTPSSFVVLASADLRNLDWEKPANDSGLYNWTIGMYTTNSGGRVFSAATVHWGHAFTAAELASETQNPPIHLTRNFLRSCLAGKVLLENRAAYPVSNIGFRYVYQTATPSAGWTPTQVALLLARPDDTDAVPLYRFVTHKEHPDNKKFKVWRETLSTDRSLATIDGWQFASIVGHVFKTQKPGTRPVYAFVTKRPEGDTERFSVRSRAMDREINGGIKFYVY